MIEPIKPLDVKKTVPQIVMRAVNEIIQDCYKKNGFQILQKDIKAKIISLLDNNVEDADIKSADDIFKNGNMDIEDVYNQYGWSVTYDKPAYCESYDAVFNFRIK